MKKLIALLLSMAIVLSFVTVPADASSYSDILGIDESKYDMALYYEHLWENYNHDMHGLLWEAVCDPQYYVYPQVVEEVGSDGWIEFASNVTDEQLTKERYIEILSNLLVMMDYNLKDLIAEQVNADSTKKLKDYVVDVTGIFVQTVSLDAAFGSHVTKNMEKIATAMDLTWGFADFTIDTIEIYESLDRTLRQYENHREFLAAIAQNTTNATLKEAAIELGEATDKAFYCKVNAVADTASGLAGYLGQDVFFDTVVLEYMVTDASVLGMSEDDIAVLGVLKSAYEYMGTLQLAADIGVFAADAIIGISDVMNRYNEMRALTDIRNALIQQMTSYRDSIQDVGDAEKIGKLCSLTKNLIYVNFRGEYCAHEMSTHDAQIYSLVIKINGQAETSNRVYEQAKENTEMYSMLVDMIFPELEFYCIDDGANVGAIDITEYYWYLNIQSWEIKSFEKDGTVKTYYTDYPLEPSEDLVLSESELKLDTFYNETYTFDGTNLVISNTDYGTQYELDLYNKDTNPAVIKDQFVEKQINEYSGNDYFYETTWKPDPTMDSDNATYLVRLGQKQNAGEGENKNVSSDVPDKKPIQMVLIT